MATDFATWIAEEMDRTGPFTALIVLVQIKDGQIDPLCSTYLNVIGAEVDWDEMTVLLAGSGMPWNGVVFLVATTEGGGPLPNVYARIRLKEAETAIQEDRLAINQGHFFDSQGRRMRVEEVEAAGRA